MLPKTYHIYKMKKWSRSRFHGLESAHLAYHCSLSMRPVKTTCNCNLLRRSDYLHVTTSPKNVTSEVRSDSWRQVSLTDAQL